MTGIPDGITDETVPARNGQGRFTQSGVTSEGKVGDDGRTSSAAVADATTRPGKNRAPETRSAAAGTDPADPADPEPLPVGSAGTGSSRAGIGRTGAPAGTPTATAADDEEPSVDTTPADAPPRVEEAAGEIAVTLHDGETQYIVPGARLPMGARRVRALAAEVSRLQLARQP